MVFPGSGSGSGGNFLEQLLGDLLTMMGSGASSGGARVELARTLAQGVATGGQSEGNVDPLERIRLEELMRVAELHVAELTGLDLAPGGAAVQVEAVTPGQWAWHTVDDWRFLLEAMTGSTPPDAGSDAGPGRQTLPGPSPGPAELADLVGGGAEGGAGELLARWMATMGPMLAAMQLGSAVGHLARGTMGQYELPVPRPGRTRLLLVPANMSRFAADWSLPEAEVRLWVCLRELTVHGVLSRAHVAERFHDLLRDVVHGVAEDTTGLVERLQGLDPDDPEALQRVLGDPESLLEAEPSPQRRRASDELMAVVAALLGYVEHVLDHGASRLLGGRSALAEAWRRRQVGRESGDRSAELLFGLDLGPGQVERGSAFVQGVVDRAGEEGLSRLWESAAMLPTPSEVDAPGLWLERIALEEAATGGGGTDRGAGSGTDRGAGPDEPDEAAPRG